MYMAPSQRSEIEMLKAHQSQCQAVTSKGGQCPQAAVFVTPAGSGPVGLVCHGHSKSSYFAGLDLRPLPLRWATECHSGDTWVTCDRHKNDYALFSSKSPKQIHTLSCCESCETLADYDS